MPSENRSTELVYWIRSREVVRCLKEAGVPPPWSHDPAIATVRYCNVKREDDKVTRWIAENWRNPHVDHPNLLPALVLARMVNWPDTLEELGFPHSWIPRDIIYGLRNRAQRGDKTWTAAYMITTCGKKMGKEDYVVGVADAVRSVAGDVWSADSLSFAHQLLTHTDGLGSFLAAQIVADLKNTPGHPLQTAPDWWSWCASGPGSKRGLNEFWCREPDFPMNEKRFQADIKACYDLVKDDILKHIGERIHMQDFQNCLCEFSKFMRFRRGGSVRNRYAAG